MLFFGFGNLDIYIWEMLETEGKKRFRFQMLLHINNTIKAGGSTVRAQNVDWVMDGWSG